MDKEFFEFVKDYGVVAFLFYFCIKEFFSYIRSKKNGNGKNNKQDISLAVIDSRLKEIETNHLPHLQKQLEINSVEHTEIKVAIAELKTIINNKVN